MAEIPHDASHATTSRYEMRWLALALGALAIILSISIGFMLANPGRIPLMAMVAMTTADVLAHPGLTRVGPHAFRAVVVARQYGFTPATLDVPVGSRVDFYVTSADVTHGFEIPGGNVNVEVFPGYVAHVYATFRKLGTYRTVCDQYCGIGHQAMLGNLAVLTETAYAASLRTAQVASPLVDGAAVFASNCASCHQASGQGVAGVFPPLAGSLGDYTKVAGGRVVLAHVLVDGLSGSIRVNGATYNGAMPAWGASLSDRQIADVIQYVTTAWGNRAKNPASFAAITPAEIASARRPALTAAAVHAERAKLPQQ